MDVNEKIISIVGPTNSGKSSLLNLLLNDKLSIVSKKINTTNKIISSQKLLKNEIFRFVDYPGFFFKNKIKHNIELIDFTKLNKYSNLVLIIIDINNINSFMINNIDFIIKKIKTNKILVLNKIDLLKKEDIYLILRKYFMDFNSHIIPISVKKRKNIDKLLNMILKKNNYLNKINASNIIINNIDKFSDFYISQIIREKLLNFLNKEIPYIIKINIIKNILLKQCWKIKAKLLLKSKNQIKIIIGKNGEKINQIKNGIIYELKQYYENKIIFSIILENE